MSAHQRGRALIADRAFHGVAHGLRLAEVRHGADQVRGAHHRGAGQGDGLPWHGVDIREVALAHLLHAAAPIKHHSLHQQRIVEVRVAGIVEGDMAVLAETDKGDVDRGFLEKARVAAALGFDVKRVANQVVHPAGMDQVGEVLAEPPAETGGMCVGYPNVLVHVEDFDAVPVDFGKSDEGGDGGPLGRPCAHDDAGGVTAGEGLMDEFAGAMGGGTPNFGRGAKDLHGGPLSGEMKDRTRHQERHYTYTPMVEQHSWEGNLAGHGYVRLEIAGCRIQAVVRLGPEQDGAAFLSPGWIDLQLNGFAGIDFSNTQLEPEAAAAVLPALWKTGVTSFCPTLITNSFENLARNFRVLEHARRAYPQFDRATPCYHLEGPWLSPEARGVHDPELMRPPDWDEFCALQEAAGGRIGILTVAPELPGALELIARASHAGVVVALGHTVAEPEQVHAAVEAGARLSTHLGNGCPQVLDRHRNPLWAQLVRDDLRASMICDGFHLPADLVRVIRRMKGPAGCILITDATHVALLPPGRYSLVDTEIELLEGGKVIRADGGSLGGSAATMSRVLRVFMEQSGAPLEEAIVAASANPARLLGRAELCAGPVPGQPANLVRFRPGGEELQIEAVLASGQRVL